MRTTDNAESIIIPDQPENTVSRTPPIIYIYCFLTWLICLAIITWTVYAIKSIMLATYNLFFFHKTE